MNRRKEKASGFLTSTASLLPEACKATEISVIYTRAPLCLINIHVLRPAFMLSRESSGKGNSESSHRKGNFLPTFRFLSGLLRVTEIVSVNLIYIYDEKKNRRTRRTLRVIQEDNTTHDRTGCSRCLIIKGLTNKACYSRTRGAAGSNALPSTRRVTGETLPPPFPSLPFIIPALPAPLSEGQDKDSQSKS